MKNIVILVCCVVLLAVVGCNGNQQTDKGRSKSPPRDTEAARQAYAKVVALIVDEKYGEAERHIKDHVLKADNMFGPAHNSLGIIYYHTQHYYKAAWEFQYACDLMPNRPEPYNNLGLVYEAAGKLTEASVSFEQAMNLEPNNPQFIGNLVRANMRNGDRGPDVRALLEQLVLKETREDWRQWAERKLNLFDKTSQ